jgi:predicted Rossmann-fold nucleotide-binding protein
LSPPRRKSGTVSPESAETVRAALRAEPGLVVLTGGQTGVDTLAARAGLAAGLSVHLAFPRGMRQEDGPVTTSRLEELRGAVLHELLVSEFAERTWACVGLADAVMLIDPAGGDGCAETVTAARQLGRPVLELTSFATGSAWGAGEAVRTFMSENSPEVLLLAGCRGSLLAATRMTDVVADVAQAAMSALADWIPDA